MKFTLLTLSSALVFATFASAAPENYIIQLDHTATIAEIVPKLISGARDFFQDLSNDVGDKRDYLLEERDVAETGFNGFHIRKSFDIGSTFKAVNVQLEDNRVLDKLRAGISEVIGVVADEKINFNLPQPSGGAAKNKRYYIRPSQNSTYAARAADTYEEQADAEWNLVRVSHKTLDATQPYIYESTAGAGVTAYIVDDGLHMEHEDFEGRASHGYTALGDGDAVSSPDPWDGGGHGTHVAGIIGGKTYGVAKKVNLVSVQVLDAEGSGVVSNLLSGLQWIVDKEKGKGNRVVVNMSLGMPSGSSQADTLDEAVASTVDAGIPVVVAAGNDASDACQQSPGGNSKAFSVGATESDDKLASYSCYGKCVDILAPGSDVKSTYIGGDTKTATMSGTSMASPHAAGVAALLLPSLEAGIAPADLYAKIVEVSTADKITSLPDSATPNQLLFNGQAKTDD